MHGRPLRVLVVDDSAANRKSISRLLESVSGIEVIARAVDGEDGLKKALELRPDVITLDLEMPKLDGYSFLRLLMARAPVPVIVLSSYNHQSDVFKALQLGAFDFVAKPVSTDRLALDEVKAELIEKVRAARFVRKDDAGAKKRPPMELLANELPAIVAIGASTGGPPAVQKVLEALSGLPVCVLVAQHMPALFTEAFAQRLDATLPFRVTQARAGDRLDRAQVFIAPGGSQLEVVNTAAGWALNVTEPTARESHAPSVDRLFRSLAKAAGANAKAVVLTGMGGDGAKGVIALGKAGAEVWAEAESSAVVFGMPRAAIATGFVNHTLPLHELGTSLARAVIRSARERRSGTLPHP